MYRLLPTRENERKEFFGIHVLTTALEHLIISDLSWNAIYTTPVLSIRPIPG
jgi:hypothetical protein